MHSPPERSFPCMCPTRASSRAQVGEAWRASPAGRRFLEWVPTAKQFEAFDFAYGWTACVQWHSLLEMGMLAHERLGNEAEALECARIILARHRKTHPRMEA